jgi:hypothetical protein
MAIFQQNDDKTTMEMERVDDDDDDDFGMEVSSGGSLM